MNNSSKPKIADRFVVHYELGQGGAGKVYKCWDERLARECAVKILTISTDQAINRFHMEAKAAARLKHPNIIRVDDFGSTSDGLLYLAMEYLSGKSLADVLSSVGRLELEEALPIISEVCAGLHHAHLSGVLHRDIKPSNVMIADDDDGNQVIKLVDFGIAKLQEVDMKLTTTGTVVGTITYMSPEAISSEKVDARSDIYSLGCMIYEMLSGKPVFDGENLFEIMMHHNNTRPLPMSEKAGIEYPEALEIFVAKCLEKDPSRRYQSTTEMDQALLELSQSLHVEYEPATAVQPVFDNQPMEIGRVELFSMIGIVVCSIIGIASLGVLIKDVADKIPDGKQQPDRPVQFESQKDIDTLMQQAHLAPEIKYAENANPPMLTGKLFYDEFFERAAKQNNHIRHWRLIDCKSAGKGLKDLVSVPIEILEMPFSPIGKVAFEYLPRLTKLTA
ncbi:MAG: serine/threonine protein kinase, partial [Cyanobacteria bacterium]|nr:serine/threonine protein kinase [Cyanobacteriota bacterium]